MNFAAWIALAARVLEGSGVAVIVGGIGAVTLTACLATLRTHNLERGYRALRQGIGRTILLGLELLVGADIIRTVAETPTLQTVTVLAGIVLIRTFLSFSLQLEVDGRWPWQAKSSVGEEP